MREILFRGKRVDNGEWVYGNLITDGEDVFILVKEDLLKGLDVGGWIDGAQSYEVIPETVGQYTGLKDKNNVKAFEGDIVVCNQSGSYGISVIIYDNSAFYVMPLNGNILERTLWDYWYNDWDIEVIGNVHDGGAYD